MVIFYTSSELGDGDMKISELTSYDVRYLENLPGITRVVYVNGILSDICIGKNTPITVILWDYNLREYHIVTDITHTSKSISILDLTKVYIPNSNLKNIMEREGILNRVILFYPASFNWIMVI